VDPKLASALEGLRDIHLPAPVSFWPPAPGWWALVALSLMIGVASVTAWRRHRSSVRRHALRELAALEVRFAAEQQPVELAVSLATLIRRVALRVSTQTGVAALHGESWVSFLSEGAKSDARSPQIARELLQTAYGGERAAAGTPREWLAFTRSWIREVA
jgi:hypothetical protein